MVNFKHTNHWCLLELRQPSYNWKGKAVKSRIHDEEIATSKKILKTYQNQVVKKLATTRFGSWYFPRLQNNLKMVKSLQMIWQNRSRKTTQVVFDFARKLWTIKENSSSAHLTKRMLKQETKAIVDDIVIDIKDISEEAEEAKIIKKAHDAFF